ncbi:flavin reductase family protein [Lederbergia sp. NSJ-179]|uniref:flavin reductase family protein n=1 Tax=Lederbergia sp. NSJ-179 TaxID=2931402 RepID=UPI001FCF7D3B|nr:flavin reductase family protein [Lederbergia sp. NSJ-179]MCJ7841753.1 flavin reductase family protein [Lederbergia sp. NSJ-179]
MDDRQFRNAMGKFATSVTVIATEVEGQIHGMTANAFMSISMNPKLIVISVRKQSSMLDLLKQSKFFSVNVLASNQKDVSAYFANQLKELEVEFARLDGKPVIKGAIAQVSCEIAGEHVEGDHTLIIGNVTDVHLEDEAPLIFYEGKYCTLAKETLV